MSTGATVALFAISSLSLLTSAATLTIVLVGAKKVEAQVEDVRKKANTNIAKIKSALDNLEL